MTPELFISFGMTNLAVAACNESAEGRGGDTSLMRWLSIFGVSISPVAKRRQGRVNFALSNSAVASVKLKKNIAMQILLD